MLYFFTNPLDQFIITTIPNFFINFKCYIAIVLVIAWLFLIFSLVHFIVNYFVRVGIMKPERWFDNGNSSNSILHTPVFDKILHFVNSLVTSPLLPDGVRSFFSFFYNLIGGYISGWWVALRNITLQIKYNFKLDPWYTFIFFVFSQLHGLFGYNYFFHNVIAAIHKRINGVGSSKLIKRRLREFFDYLLEIELSPEWLKNRRNYTIFHSIRLYAYQSGFFRPAFWDIWVLSLSVGLMFLVLSFLPSYQFYLAAPVNNIFFSFSNWEVMNSLAVVIPILAALSLNPQIEKILITGNISPIKGYDWFLHLLFFSIITANLAGLIPSSMTATSFASLTFFLSFSTFAGINIIGLAIHGLRFTNLFYPGGAPIVILPFLIWIELISYAARAFSLGIRLFANMVAGHILIKIIGGWLWSALTFSPAGESKFFIADKTLIGPTHAKGSSHFSPFFIFLIGSLFLFFSSERFKNFYAQHFYGHIEAISEQLIDIWTVFSNYSESPMKHHRTTSFIIYTNIKVLLVKLGAIDSTTGELIKDGWKFLSYSVFTALVVMLNYWFCLGKLSLVSAFIKMSSLFIFMAFVAFLVIYRPERNIQLISFSGLIIFFNSVIFEGSLNLTIIFSLVVYLAIVRTTRIEGQSQKILLSAAALLRLSFIIQMFIIGSWLVSHFLAFSWLKASSLIITLAGFLLLGILLSLEFLIACLQAYIFVTLTAIYLKDVIKH